MLLSKNIKGKASAAPAAPVAPAPAPAPEPAKATVPPPAPVSPEPVQSTELALFDERLEADALLAAARKAEQSAAAAAGSPFPEIAVTPGEKGGMWSPADSIPAEIQQILAKAGLAGRQPVNAIYLGYRVDVIGWAHGYSQQLAEGSKPVFGFAVPKDPVQQQAVQEACEAYMFTPNADKAKFDLATGGPGHLRPSFRVLVYLAGVGIVVLSAPNHHYGWTESAAALARCIDPNTGKLGRFPAVIAVKSVEMTYKSGYKNKNHAFEFGKWMDSAAAAAWEECRAYLEDTTATDPVSAQTIRDWVTGTGAEMTDAHRAAVEKARSFRRTR